jgi:hydroxymethylpyrimidine pyrophosphatase-like HAD family hydrolase
MDQVMAIGDGTNDISLLAAAGLAVAMQNAPDSLKPRRTISLQMLSTAE